jgi:hypothetical protein
MSTDTPRTDAEIMDAKVADFGYGLVLADFARKLERELSEEKAIVDRIWKLFGPPTYEELKGRSIYELIQGVQKEKAELERKLADARDELNISRRQWKNEVDGLRLRIERLNQDIDELNQAHIDQNI